MTKNAMDISLEKRKCKKKSEASSLDIFKTYSKEACLMENQLKVARKHCGCTPWEYPIVPGYASKICDVFGTICFERTMKSVSTSDDFDCPNSCDAISYSLSVSSTPLVEESLCPPDHKTMTTDLFHDFYGN